MLQLRILCETFATSALRTAPVLAAARPWCHWGGVSVAPQLMMEGVPSSCLHAIVAHRLTLTMCLTDLSTTGCGAATAAGPTAAPQWRHCCELEYLHRDRDHGRIRKKQKRKKKNNECRQVSILFHDQSISIKKCIRKESIIAEKTTKRAHHDETSMWHLGQTVAFERGEDGTTELG